MIGKAAWKGQAEHEQNRKLRKEWRFTTDHFYKMESLFSVSIASCSQVDLILLTMWILNVMVGNLK